MGNITQCSVQSSLLNLHFRRRHCSVHVIHTEPGTTKKKSNNLPLSHCKLNQNYFSFVKLLILTLALFFFFLCTKCTHFAFNAMIFQQHKKILLPKKKNDFFFSWTSSCCFTLFLVIKVTFCLLFR